MDFGQLIVQHPVNNNTRLMDFSTDGNYLAYGWVSGANSYIRVFDIVNDQIVVSSGWRGAPFTAISFTSPPNLLAVSYGDSIDIWDVAANIKLRTLSGRGTVQKALFDPANSHILVSGHSDGQVYVWNLGTGSYAVATVSPTPTITPTPSVTPTPSITPSPVWTLAPLFSTPTRTPSTP